LRKTQIGCAAFFVVSKLQRRKIMEEKEYLVEVTSVVRLRVAAASPDEAEDKACGMAWEYDADELSAKILDVK